MLDCRSVHINYFRQNVQLTSFNGPKHYNTPTTLLLSCWVSIPSPVLSLPKNCYLSLISQAKFDFVDEMLRHSEAVHPQRILDVGCGIGGSSRHLAAKLPGSTVEGAIIKFPV